MFYRVATYLSSILIAIAICPPSILSLNRSRASLIQSSPTPTSSSTELETIAFTAQAEGRRNIYLIKTDGSNLSRITDSVDATNPSWSRDGKLLAFSSTGEQGWSIYVLDKNDPNPILLADGNSAFPAWSPLNDLIAFVSWRSGRPRLYTMNINGSNQRQLSDIDIRSQAPVWSPDGKYLAFVSTLGELYLININSFSVQKIADSGESPSWSPNSTQIAYSGFGEEAGWDIFSIDLARSESQNLTPNLTDDARYPDWSPNGDFITFLSVNPQGGGIIVMDNDGSHLNSFSFSSEVWSEPVWSPDGEHISFIANCGDHNGVYVVYSNGSGGSCITRLDVDSGAPVWLPH